MTVWINICFKHALYLQTPTEYFYKHSSSPYLQTNRLYTLTVVSDKYAQSFLVVLGSETCDMFILIVFPESRVMLDDCDFPDKMIRRKLNDLL